MKTSITRIAILAGLAFSTTALNAAIVNLNILRTGTAGTVTNPGYGLWSQGTEVWNVTAATSATNLVDSTGAATAVGFSLASFSGSNLNASWGVDDLTQQGKFGPTDDTTVHNATVSGLTVGGKYDLIFYFSGNNRNEIQTANGDAPSDFTGSTTTTGNATYVDGFDVNVSTTVAHFWYFASVTANASGEISMDISGPGYETATGFQIQAIPEPGTALLGGLGLLALLRRRR